MSWEDFAAGKTPSSVEFDRIFYRYVKKGSSVLDFGCAWGRISKELIDSGYQVSGFDLNQNEIEIASGLSGEFIVADAKNLPYPDNSFDSGVMQMFLCTIVPIEDADIVLREARRVLRPGAFLYIASAALTESNPRYLERYRAHQKRTGMYGTWIVTEDGSLDGEELYQVHHYGDDEIKNLLSKYFTIVTIEKKSFTSYHGNSFDGFIIVCRN